MNVRRLPYRLILLLLAAGIHPAGVLVAQPVPTRPAPAPGWIGISFSEQQASSGEIVVEEVIRGAPAEAAGIRAGDRVVRWNGRTDVAQAVRVASLQPGDTVRIRVARQGERDRDLTVVAARRPPAYAELRPGRDGVVAFRRGDGGEWLRFDADSLVLRMDSLQSSLRLMLRDSLGPRLEAFRQFGPSEFRLLNPDSLRAFEWFQGSPPIVRFDSINAWGPGGFGVALFAGRSGIAGADLTELTPGLASYFGTENGLLVLRIAPDTPAARAGLHEGDVIVSAAGQRVDAIPELRRLVAGRNQRETQIEVIRRGARQTLTLRP